MCRMILLLGFLLSTLTAYGVFAAFEYDTDDDSWAAWRGGISGSETGDGIAEDKLYESRRKPNIVIMLLDDWGWNDVGYHNPELHTPNIDQLAKQGLILEQHYTAAYCTPSRAALMTGMYPYHIGRQRWIFENSALAGLTLQQKLLPEYLKELNYSTHLVGKWHLGHCNQAYLPKSRGFDTQFGGFLAAHYPLCHVDISHPNVYDFFDEEQPFKNFSAVGNSQMDMFDKRTQKLIFDHSAKGNELVHGQENPLFLYLAYTSNHFPVVAPAEFMDLYPGVSDAEKRRTNMAMSSHMDSVIGNAIEALKDAGLYENTIIVLMGDNGAYSQKWAWLNFHGGGSNEPLRGQKGLYYEGGTRVPALIHSPQLNRTGRSHDMIHMSDWLPTLISAAGGNAADYPELKHIDGKDQYHSFFCGEPAPRKAFVYNLQEVGAGQANKTESHVVGAVRYGRWKLLNFDDAAKPLMPVGTFELYDLENDPNETTDLFASKPREAKLMIEKFQEAASSIVPEHGMQKVPDDLLKVIHDSLGNLRTDFCTLNGKIREELLKCS